MYYLGVTLVALSLLALTGCGTMLSISENEPFPNIVYGGTRLTLNSHEAALAPIAFVLDTLALPYTIPKTLYNNNHPENRKCNSPLEKEPHSFNL